MTTTTRGLVVADSTILDRLPKAAFRVRSFDNTHSPAAQAELLAYCKANGLIVEFVAHGRIGGKRRHVALVYPSTEHGWKYGRRNAFASLEGWTPA